MSVSSSEYVDMKTNTPLDYETKKVYNMLLQATNIDEPALTGIDIYKSTINFRINVVDVNDNAPVFANTIYAVNVPEDTRVGSSLVTTVASDADSNPIFRYEIVGTSSLFEIDAPTGAIRLKASLDREVQDAHDIFVTVFDGVFYAVCKVTVKVTDVNDNTPSFSEASYTFTLSEETVLNSVVLRLRATDPDLGNNATLMYTIVSGNTNNQFALQSSTGDLSSLKKLDYETTKLYTLVIQVADAGNPIFRQNRITVTINVADVNDNNPIFTQSLYTATIPDSTSLNSAVLTLSAADSDASVLNNQMTYTISDTFVKQFFTVQPSGDLILTKALNYDLNKEFRFTVQAKDGRIVTSRHRTADVVITITDTNNQAPVFSRPSSSITISEATMVGTSVFKVLATDKDTVGQLKYDLETPTDTFQIDQQSGDIIVVKLLDRETTSSYVLNVNVTDGVQAASTPRLAIVVIILADVDDNEPVFGQKLYEKTVREDITANQLITTVQATDADSGTNANIVYSIDSSMPSAANFKVDANGQVFTKTSLDYETNKEHEFQVVATDQGVERLKGYANVLIKLTDVNDVKPSFVVSSYTVSVREDAPVGTPLVFADAADPDTNDALTFTIVSGNPRNALNGKELFTLIGRQLTLNDALNYENKIFHLLTISVADSAGNRADSPAKVQINVLEVNDNRPVFSPSSYTTSIDESTPSGTTIVSLNATDADSGAANKLLRYSMEANSNFKIDSSTGEVKTISALDYEKQDKYTLTVVAHDNGTPSLSTTMLLTIIIRDVDDSRPHFVHFYYNLTVSEKVPVGSTLVKLLATDVDTASSGLSFFSGDLSAPFSLNPVTGAILTSRRLDYEKNERFFNFTVQVSDGTLSSLQSATVMIKVIDVNDNQPTFDLDIYRFVIDENTSVGASVGRVRARDSDADKANNVLDYTMSHDYFSIRTNGDVITTRSFDYENVTKYEFTVSTKNIQKTLIDQLTSTTTVIIDVLDINDNSPVPENANLEVNITESTTVGSLVVTVYATDADSTTNGELTYSISGTGASTFSINNKGVIRLAGKLDRLSQPTYSLSVLINDKNVSPKFAIVRVKINVQQVQLPGIIVSGCPQTFSVAENSAAGRSIHNFTVEDSGTFTSRSVSYQVVGGSTLINGKFSVTSGGELKKIGWVDYETLNRYNFLLKATNERGATAFCYVTVNIADINESPSFAHSNYAFNVSENSFLYTTIYSIQASDADLPTTSNGQLDYSIIPITALQSGQIQVDNSGRIYLTKSLNREQTQMILFNMQVTDRGTNKLRALTSFSVTVLDRNDVRPTIVANAKEITVAENTKQANFFKLSAFDLDAGTNGQVEFVGVYPEGILDVSTSGSMSVIGALDFEVQQVHKFIVVAKDKGEPFLQTYIPFTLNVLNVNDNDPSFTVTSYYISMSKLAPIGTSILTTQATDADKDNFGIISRYFIATGNMTVFNIDNNGVIRTIRNLNDPITGYLDTYELTIIAYDSAGRVSSNTAKVTIKVVDYTGPHFDLDSYQVTIPEDTPTGSSITIVAASGVSGRELDWAIVSNSNNRDFFWFRIDKKNGKMTITNRFPFDYETKKSYSFLVEVSDAVNAMTHRTLVKVIITDVNDNTPQIQSNQVFNLTESTLPGTVVTSLYATDSDDGVNKEIVFSAQGGDGMSVFTASPNGDVQLKTPLDANKKSFYTLVVQASDKGSPPLTTSTTLFFYVHTSYAVMTKQDVVFAEDTALNTLIATVTATDPNMNSSVGFTYSLVNPVLNNLFTIDVTTGRITLAGNLDYEAATRHRLVVLAKGPTSSGVVDVTVSITDVNDNFPIFDKTSYSLTFNENTVTNQRLLKVTARDVDSNLNGNNLLTYAISSQTSGDYFGVDATSGNITIVKNLDREVRKSYQLTITASDAGSPQRTSLTPVNINVNVENVNDNKPVFTKALYQVSVEESKPVGTSILTVVATDADRPLVVTKPTYSITQPLASQFFTIDPTTGVVTLKRQLDYETTTRYDFSVIATDQGRVAYTSTANVEVTVSNAPDLLPRFSPSYYNISVPESTLLGTPIIRLNVVDSTTNLQFTITNGNQDVKFTMGADTIVLARKLDRETKDRYTLTVMVTDGVNQAQAPSTVDIFVLDVNDNAPISTLSGCITVNDISENIPSGKLIAFVAARDFDAGANGDFTFSFSPPCNGFRVNATSGAISTTTSLDFELAKDYTCVINMVDGGTPALSGSTCLKMTIRDENDNKPIFQHGALNVVVKESARVGTVLTSVFATDADSGSNSVLTYKIVSGNTDGFLVDQHGRITTSVGLDKERTRIYNLVVEATDTGDYFLVLFFCWSNQYSFSEIYIICLSLFISLTAVLRIFY